MLTDTVRYAEIREADWTRGTRSTDAIARFEDLEDYHLLGAASDLPDIFWTIGRSDYHGVTSDTDFLQDKQGKSSAMFEVAMERRDT
ncbi:hypothetical protein N7523_006558 [Penicillium sp. IBT 18751x]|nr:hypothetical protein N7523_006558 [Penicillium sp. IBT 18751x]